jgi:hypothetical protein
MSTEIIKKLRVGKCAYLLVQNRPFWVDDFDGMEFDTYTVREAYDAMFAFVFTMDEVRKVLREVIDGSIIRPGGHLYIVYPKKGNKRYAESIGRDDFFDPSIMDKDGYAMGSRLKFNRMVAFDTTFTCIGLKNVPEERAKRGSKQSQSVYDYVARQPAMEAKLRKVCCDRVIAFYENLTPGYKRDWARYVYGVKSEETSNRRFLEMTALLSEGYKSIDHHRQERI